MRNGSLMTALAARSCVGRVDGCGGPFFVSKDGGESMVAAIKSSWFWAPLLVLLTQPCLAGIEEYRLAFGDVVEISVIGAPDLRHRAAIDADGRVSLPLLGRMKAAGLTLSQLQSSIRELLPTKVFRRRTEDGREYPVLLTPDEVTLSVAEYRPVYVNGDVAKPGQQAFRPGLTVRQALALSGGYDVMRFRAKDPFLESANLRSEYTSLWTEFAREQIRISRLQAELRGSDQLDLQGLVKTPIADSVISGLENLEREQLIVRDSDHKKEKESLVAALKQQDDRYSILSDQLKKEQEDSQGDLAEYVQAKQNLDRGVIPSTRVAEQRRNMLFSASRALQTSAMMAQLDKDRVELHRKLQATDDRRRIALLAELEEARMRLATIQAKIQSVGEKVVYAGVVRSQLIRGTGDGPNVTIFRTGRGTEDSFAAKQDTELLPGDVVEVSVRSEDIPIAGDNPNQTATSEQGAAKPNEEVNPAPLPSAQSAQPSENIQHHPAPEENTSTSDHPKTQQSAPVDVSPFAAPTNLEGRVSGEPDRSASKDERAPTKGTDQPRETLLGNDRLADSLLRTHIFDRGKAEQILGFAEPDQSLDEYSPHKLRPGAKHHHHREHRAFRHGRFPRA